MSRSFSMSKIRSAIPPISSRVMANFPAKFEETLNDSSESSSSNNEDFEPSGRINEEKLFNRSKVPSKILEQQRSLPIYRRKNEIIQFIRNNQFVIVIGETGSGKSTQIPQYIVDANLVKDGSMVGITQPRRVAAKSIAQRVATECGVELGTIVGYAVRFDRCVSSNTVIKYMTDGLLVKDCTQEEPNLNSYSVIMIDEAHERSLHTDVSFGLLKRAARNRPDLKIIICSATLEVAKFSQFFDNAPVFSILTKCYEVELIYEPSSNYLKDVVNTVVKIHETNENTKGDILVFLTGQDTIETVREEIKTTCIETQMLPFTVVPCYSALSFVEQQEIFEDAPVGHRKIVLATNIAETSITIEGIVFVIDCGYVKQKRYNPSTKIKSLVEIPITKFQAIQREGRAGRTQPGKCYRLYSKETYEAFSDAPQPDIQRANVEAVFLDLLALGVDNPMHFEFVDYPSAELMREALTNLQELSALDSELKLTDLGRHMAAYPLDPPLAKVLISSVALGCSREVLKIVSVLSTHQHQRLFTRKGNRDEIQNKKELFFQSNGDHLTFLEIYEQWVENDCSEEWCEKNFLQFRYLDEAQDIEIQLTEIMKKNKLLSSKGDRFNCHLSQLRENICKAFIAGYFFHLGKKRQTGRRYQKLTTSGEAKDVFLHPTSALFKQNPLPEWIIFHDVMETSKSKIFVEGATVIEPKWIKEYAPNFASTIEKKYAIKIE